LIKETEEIQMTQIQDIMEIMNVSKEEAIQIEDVVGKENLLDWSEATLRQYKAAFKLAQTFIANGRSWE
jgi:hypothetical protein